MQRLKVTAYLTNSRIIYNGDMYLDGILYNQKIKVTNKSYRNFSNRAVKGFCRSLGKVELPVSRHTNEQIFSFDESKNISYHNQKNSNVWLASRAIIPKKSKHFIDKCRKRFEDIKAEDWVRDNKRIYTSSGKYKNYNISFSVTLTPKVYRICIGDKEELKELLSGIYAIGKEINRGFGRVERWEIEETNEFGQRHFPTRHIALHEWIENKRCMPPYSLRRDKLSCCMRWF